MIEKIVVNGIEINIKKKKIKNLHLYVKPPIGEVFVSAPEKLSNEKIQSLVTSKISWIKKQKQKYLDSPPVISPEYISGESISVWGQSYTLDVIYSNKKNHIVLCEDKIVLQVRETSTAKQRENYMNQWYREQLKNVLPPIIEKYEGLMGVHANEWKTKNMITRWGTCNIRVKRIWINLQLAKKKPECLEYVVVHELCHLLEKNHNSVFKGYMDKYFSNWRAVKKDLNLKNEI